MLRDSLLTIHVLGVIVWLGFGGYELLLSHEIRKARGTAIVPYVGGIKPVFEILRPGQCEVTLTKRRSLLNGYGSIHLAALSNVAELAAAAMIEVTLPLTHRWITKSMNMQFHKKAMTDVRAVSALDPIPVFGEAQEVPLTAKVLDTEDQLVATAVFTMWVSPKKR